MKKRMVFALFTLMMFFTACGDDISGMYEAAAGMYGAAAEFSATVRVTMDHGEYLTDYVLSQSYRDSTHTVTVCEPLGMAGLSFTADGSELTLRFGDAVFLPQSLNGTGATPVKLLPDALNCLSRGYYEGMCLVPGENGEKLFSVCMWSTVDGDEFMHRMTLSAETLFPVCNEIFFEGRSVMTCEYSEVSLVQSADSGQNTTP